MFEEFANDKETTNCFKRCKEKEKALNSNNAKWPEIEKSLKTYSSLIEAVKITSSLCACSPIISEIYENNQDDKEKKIEEKKIEETKSIPQIVITSIESNDQ